MLYTHTPAISPTIHAYRPSTHQHTPRLSALKLQPTTCNAQSYPLRSCPPPHTYVYILEGTHITQTHKHKAQMTKPPESTPKGQAFPFASKAAGVPVVGCAEKSAEQIV